MYYEQLADKERHLLFTKYTPINAPKGTETPHYHSSIEIYLVGKGEFSVSVGGEKKRLKEGEIAFVNGHTPHFCCPPDTDMDFEVYVIVANTSYFDKKEAKTDSIAAFSGATTERWKIIRFVEAMYEMNEKMNHEMRIGFVNLILGMLKNECMTESAPRKEKTNLTVQIMRYIDTSYTEPIDLDLLSKKFGYEPTYISRVFNKCAGVNLHQYLNRTRYSATKKMLAENPAITVASAALACGFQSIKTYYRVAKHSEQIK